VIGVSATLLDTVGEMPYRMFAAIHADPVDPLPVYEVSSQLSTFPPQAAEALLEAAGPGADTPALMVEIRHLGGALARPPRTPNAVGVRAAQFQLFAGAVGAPGAARPSTRRCGGWCTPSLRGPPVTPRSTS
jgi:hypothetical protein